MMLFNQAMRMLGIGEPTSRHQPTIKTFTEHDQLRLDAAVAKRARRVVRNSTHSRTDTQV